MLNLKPKARAFFPAKPRLTRADVVHSAAAGAYIFAVFAVMHYFRNYLAVASLGASAFIAFSHPDARLSAPRFIIGGYVLGILCGLACGGAALLLKNRLPFPDYIPACALAVFSAMLLMTLFGLEHPPAAALAVAVTVDSNPLVMGFLALCCVALLCALIRLGKRMKHNDISEANDKDES